MIKDLLKDNVGPQAYKRLVQLFGEPEEVQRLRKDLEAARQGLAQGQKDAAADVARLEAEVEKAREERLGWMAKESAVRKELQDCQERSKDLLEQVVRLTHQKRESAKDLLDQKFRTEAQPLERTRFEMELTEARGNVRRAEERVKAAEEKLARNQAQFDDLRKQAKRAKRLDADLAWARKQSEAHLTALGASITRIRLLEGLLNRLESTRGARQVKRYQKPAIGQPRDNVRNAYLALTA